jgi:PKD repeat protein
MRSRILGLLAAVLAAASCTVHQADVPNPSGPSTTAKSLAITVAPDTLTQNGFDTASIQVNAYGPDGRLMTSCPDQPQQTCQVHLDLLVNNQLDDYGTLSARTLPLSGGSGKASFTAPQPLPPGAVFNIDTITIRATLMGTDAQGASSALAAVHLTPPGGIVPSGNTPVAQFTFAPQTPAANSAVVFDGSASCAVQLDPTSKGCPASINDITNFVWDFGDGGQGFGVSASHTFATASTYSVTLTVKNKFGVVNSVTHAVTVGGGALPSPKFVFSPTAPVVNQAVQFNAQQSIASPGHTVVQYAWDFGDGTMGSGVTTSHAFAAAATYNVTLTVVDDAGQTSSTSQPVAVGTGDPIVVLTASTTTPTHGVADSFVAQVTFFGGATGVQYLWNFNDGTAPQTTATPSVSHTFANPGAFLVTVQVTDSANRVGTGSISGTVQ